MGQKNRSLALLFFYAALLRRSAAGEIYFWKSAALYVYLFIFRKRFFDFWTAVAYSRFHQDLMQRMITLIGCLKLDQGDTSTRHSEIFSLHVIRSVTVAVMEVLCCSEVTTSLQQSTAYQQTVDPVESRYDFEKQNIERIKKRSGHHEQDT